jgi:hypothetical protein
LAYGAWPSKNWASAALPWITTLFRGANLGEKGLFELVSIKVPTTMRAELFTRIKLDLKSMDATEPIADLSIIYK